MNIAKEIIPEIGLTEEASNDFNYVNINEPHNVDGAGDAKTNIITDGDKHRILKILWGAYTIDPTNFGEASDALTQLRVDSTTNDDNFNRIA